MLQSAITGVHRQIIIIINAAHVRRINVHCLTFLFIFLPLAAGQWPLFVCNIFVLSPLPLSVVVMLGS